MMNKRDTIIIAVLVNAGLLMVLFATAFRSNKSEKETPGQVQLAKEASQAPSDIAIGQTPSPLLSNEEVDQVLDQFVAAPTLGDTTIQEDSLAQVDQGLEIAPSAPVVAPVPQTQVAQAPTETRVQASTPTKAPEGTITTVTVKKGDFLEKIAKANNSTVASIMKANNMSSTQLKIGQVLKVPSKGQAAAKASTTEVASTSAPASSQSEFYTVKEGDSPWLIASKNHVKLDELLRLNNLDEQKARKLRPGDRLRIR